MPCKCSQGQDIAAIGGAAAALNPQTANTTEPHQLVPASSPRPPKALAHSTIFTTATRVAYPIHGS